MAAGRIRCGIGGWTFEPWRGVFYPKGLKQADEFDPTWDPKGFVADGTLLFELGEKLANSREWPEWKAGSEFKAERDKTTAARK
jgi:hypothetical protein